MKLKTVPKMAKSLWWPLAILTRCVGDCDEVLNHPHPRQPGFEPCTSRSHWFCSNTLILIMLHRILVTSQ